MKFDIKPFKIDKKPENQVKSHHIFKKGERRINDEYQYDPEGLSSYQIFGKIGSCRCLQQKKTTDGYCKVCNTRVIDPNNMPDFYIDLGVTVPKLYTPYNKYRYAQPLLTYTAFLATDGKTKYLLSTEKYTPKQHKKYNDKFQKGDEILVIRNLTNKKEPWVITNPNTYNYTKFCKNKKLYLGEDAVKKIYKDIQPWLDKYTTKTVYVPHTTQRSNLKTESGKVTISDLNKLYAELLHKIHITQSYALDYTYNKNGDNTYNTINYYTTSYNTINTAYQTTMKQVFNLLTTKDKSYIRSNLRTHRVVCAIKGTWINRYDLNEDIVLIGDTFIPTLYPYLWKQYEGNIPQINQHLIANNEIVLLNRAPTICHLSIVACKPRIASQYPIGTFTDGATGLPPTTDLTTYLQNQPNNEIDTLGIRTIAINPTIANGMAGDFDGDTVFVIPLFSKQAKEEAYNMVPSKNFMNFANGRIRNEILEDIAFANMEKHKITDTILEPTSYEDDLLI